MKYKFQIEKKNFKIEIADNATFYSETNLKINRKKMIISIGESDEREIKSFFLNNKLFQIEIERDTKGYPTGIFVNGEYYSASLLRLDKLFYLKEKRPKSSTSGIAMSFLPGSIKRIYYQKNDRVNENDIVLIHEAMKMQNEIRAPKSGIIKSMGVSEGENILANHILFEIE